MRLSIYAFLCVTCFGGALASAETGVASPDGLDGLVKVEQLPVPDDPLLAKGRDVWGGTCQNCHGGNKYTGAPKITSTKAWNARIDQGMDVLVDHALNGFVGPKYMEMPARGGNEDLTDEQVKLAVAFMVWVSGGVDPALDFLAQLPQ
jgi:cytochrome c5